MSNNCDSNKHHVIENNSTESDCQYWLIIDFPFFIPWVRNKEESGDVIWNFADHVALFMFSEQVGGVRGAVGYL